MPDVRLVQAFFPGYPRPIQAVQFPDGPRGATVRSLCKFASLAYAAQSHRIRRTPGLKDAIRTIILNTPGGHQATDVLLDWAISIWATGLQTTRLSEEKQTVALILKEGAVAAIEQALSPHSPVSEQEAPAQPVEAPTSAIGQIRQTVLLLAENFSTLEAEWQEERRQSAAELQEQRSHLAALEGKHQALVGE